MTAILREPLVHFLLGGLLLFVAFQWLGEGEGAPDEAGVIVVDRAALLEFVQNRTKVFEPALAAERLDALSPAERERMIADFLREEALHREALALGLDRDDYIIRRRLVQKLEFVAQGFAEAGTAVGAAELASFFEAHRDDYREPPSVTFTHVFFDAERRGREEARREAAAALASLERDRVGFADAAGRGDRFLYHRNYVERTPDYVGSHFGPAMAQAVFAIEPGDGRWHGPFESPYGAHLVLVSARRAARTPSLDEIRGRVEDDARRARVRERTEAAIREIVDRYEVRLETMAGS
ncbi:MAG: peptidylprolyl isomerase [Myxococcota bacterium]|nr:peptidylprolyl isomerase [Myxococcota bacterium]